RKVRRTPFWSVPIEAYAKGRIGSRRDQGKSTGARPAASVQGPVWWTWGGSRRPGSSRAAGSCATWASLENSALKFLAGDRPHARRCRLIVPRTPEKIHSKAAFPARFRSQAPMPARWGHGKIQGGTLGSALTGKATAALTNGRPRYSATVPPAHS